MALAKTMKWTPRVLVILFILFISMFAFDVFWEGYGVLEMFVALFMHLIPSFVLIILLTIAWKWELWGGILFLVLGVVFTLFFKTYTDPINFILISFPVFVIGLFFIISHRLNR